MTSRARFIWGYVRRWRLRLALALSALAFVSASSLLFPWLLKVMIDRLGGGGPAEGRIDGMAVLLLVVLTLSAAAGYYEQVEFRRLGRSLRNAMRRALFASLIARPMAFHRASRVGELSARASEDIARLDDLFTGLLAPVFQNTLFIAGCLALMFALNWAATLLVVLLVLLPLPVVARLSRRIRPATARNRAAGAEAHAIFDESLAAVREIKAFGRQQLESARYERALDAGLQAEEEGSRLQVGINQTVYLIVSGALLAIFYLGTRRTFLPAWTLGDVIAFYFYSYTMTMALLSAGKVYLSAQEVAGALERVMHLLAEEPPRAVPPAAGNIPESPGVEIQDVRFGYERHRAVLDGFSLSIRPGRWQVICGPSGSGKSTLAALLVGLYRPDAGTVLVGGVPPEHWGPDALRRIVGYAPQEPVLLHGTLRENIAFADQPASPQMIERAIATSCLTSLVESLPRGIDTVIGERGYTLSGGEKSRVAVARAILHDPPVLILDEVNTMLDAELERRLWANLSADRAAKTTIVITHHPEGVPAGDEALEIRRGAGRAVAAEAL